MVFELFAYLSNIKSVKNLVVLFDFGIKNESKLYLLSKSKTSISARYSTSLCGNVFIDIRNRIYLL